MSFCLIILAGGNSHRFKSTIGKPYQKIAGKSLLEINVNKARQFKQIKKIISLGDPGDGGTHWGLPPFCGSGRPWGTISYVFI